MTNTKPIKVKPPGSNGSIETSVELAQPQWKALTLDAEYYQAFLDDAAISEDRKREMVETLWQIIVAFVDLGFGVHPAQQARNADRRTEPDTAIDLIRQFASETETTLHDKEEIKTERIDA